jgi:hypothetical protein
MTHGICEVFTLNLFLSASTCISFSAGGVMVSMLALSEVDHGFEPQSGQTKDYEIGMCCFSAKHTAQVGSESG